MQQAVEPGDAVRITMIGHPDFHCEVLVERVADSGVYYHHNGQEGYTWLTYVEVTQKGSRPHP